MKKWVGMRMENRQVAVEHLINKYVSGLEEYNAGLSIEKLKQMFQVDRIAKLGSNESPFSPSDDVLNALQEANHLALYPDSDCGELRRVLAEKMAIDESLFVFGNGSEDLISIISRTFIDVGDKVMTVVPSFGLHILYPVSCGAKMLIAPMTEELEFDIEKIEQLLKDEQPKVFFIASPSNPVGCSLNQEDIHRILKQLSNKTLLVFDEAYYEYSRHDEDYPDVLSLLKGSGKPFVLLRTLSKAYSLAGLRVGYGVFCPAKLGQYINKVKTPFNVNSLAQKAAIAAINDEAHVNRTVNWNYFAREKMMSDLRSLGLFPHESKGNFLFFSTQWDAVDLAQDLLRCGVIVKPWMEQGYKQYLRVSIGGEADNSLFISSLANVLEVRSKV